MPQAAGRGKPRRHGADAPCPCASMSPCRQRQPTGISLGKPACGPNVGWSDSEGVPLVVSLPSEQAVGTIQGGGDSFASEVSPVSAAATVPLGGGGGLRAPPCREGARCVGARECAEGDGHASVAATPFGCARVGGSGFARRRRGDLRARC